MPSPPPKLNHYSFHPAVLTCKHKAMPTPDTTRHTPASMDAPTIDERANHCFGCGPANPQGLHLTFITDTSDPNAITAT